MEQESKYYVAVVPINPTGQVLLGLRKEDGIWTTPGGGANPGETPEEVAVRECFEEAQLIVLKSQLEPLGVVDAPNGKPVHCFLYRTTQSQTSVRSDPDKEVPEWGWYSQEELPSGLSREKNKNRLDTINKAFLYFYGLNKSIVQMGHHTDGGDLDTSDFGHELETADQELLKHLYYRMDDYQYGDVPVEFDLDAGTLYLVKVDEGLYSGFFKYKKPVVNEETNEVESMEDTAKVRIEKQTLPTLAQTVVAKGWVAPPLEEPCPCSVSEEDYEDLNEALTNEVPVPEPEEQDRTIVILELLNKLLAS